MSKKKGLKTTIKVGDRKVCVDYLGEQATSQLIELLQLHQAKLMNMRSMCAVRTALYKSLRKD